MAHFKHVNRHCSAVLFLLLLPPVLPLSHYDAGNEDGGFLASSETSLWEDSALVVKRSAESFTPSRSTWRPTRVSASYSDKRHVPYHPVVRFRTLKPNFQYPTMKYPRRFEDRLKNDITAGEILALLSNIMIERTSQGRLKGLRFGMSKR